MKDTNHQTSAPAPLRILHLASHGSLQRGGAVQMIRLARGLALRGHIVHAAFNAPDGRLPEGAPVRRAAEAGVQIFSLDLQDPRSARKLREIWEQNAFDVLHVHREEALIFAARALAGLRVPCFVAQRGTVYLPGWFSEEHRLLFSRVDRIVAVSRAVKNALVWRRLIPPRKIEVIYGGVDTTLFHPGVDGRAERARRGVPDGAPVVTLVAALVEKKGIDDFLRAAALVRRVRPDARFWIAGSGKLEEKMKALAAELGARTSRPQPAWERGRPRPQPPADFPGALDSTIPPLVDFLGRCDAMPELYAASDLVVCASTKGEGLTGTLREALAMGRPVVTTACAGNTELVEEGRTGYVARRRDPRSLAGAMLRALGDLPRAGELARAGRERVLAWSDESIRSEKVEALYRVVLRARDIS